MAKVNAKCTNCGEVILIESKNDANICPHCNCAFVTEKAIKLYIYYTCFYILFVIQL